MNIELYQHLLAQLASRLHEEGEPVFSYLPKYEHYSVHYPVAADHRNPQQNGVFHEYNPSWSQYMEVLGLATVLGLDFDEGGM